MAEELYVDWDGLVYYDGKIKDYIDEKAEVNIKMGGFTKFENLPDPSVTNLNYIYKITDSFVTNSDFKDPNLACSANTWVQCTEFDNVFLYTLFNESAGNIDLDKYATIDYVDKKIAEIESPDVDLDGYATEEYVDEAIRNIPEVDLSDYYTKGELDAMLPDSFVTSQDVDSAIETALEDVVYSTQLTEINESIAEVETALEEKADKTELTGLASEQFVIDKIAQIDIPEVPTKVSELENDKNYITLNDIPETDLSDYSTTDQMQAAINAAESAAKSYTDTEISDFNTETVAPIAARVEAIEKAPYATTANVATAKQEAIDAAKNYADGLDHEDTTYTVAATDNALEFTITPDGKGEAQTIKLVAPTVNTGIMEVAAGEDIVITPGENGKVTIAHEAFATGEYTKTPTESDKTGDVYMMTGVTVDNGHVTGANVQSLAHALMGMKFILDGGTSAN